MLDRFYCTYKTRVGTIIFTMINSLSAGELYMLSVFF